MAYLFPIQSINPIISVFSLKDRQGRSLPPNGQIKEVKFDLEVTTRTLYPENPLAPCKRLNISRWHVKDRTWIHSLLGWEGAASIKSVCVFL